jgi:hypothetical protein
MFGVQVMNLIAMIFALLLGTSVFASQDFTCTRLEVDGTYGPSSFEFTILNARAVEISTDWDIDGVYSINSAPTLIWTTFNSPDYLNVSLRVEGKMFWGRSGQVKQILHSPGYADETTVFFCIPGTHEFKK